MTRHRWNYDLEKRLAACESPDGNGRTERTCVNEGCGMTKITVHPPQGLPWREWRTKDGKPWHGDSTPPCLARAEPKAVAETSAEVIAI